MHDDKPEKHKGQYDVDNWDKCRSKRHCLVDSAKELLKEDQLQKYPIVLEDDSQDES